MTSYGKHGLSALGRTIPKGEIASAVKTSRLLANAEDKSSEKRFKLVLDFHQLIRCSVGYQGLLRKLR